MPVLKSVQRLSWALLFSMILGLLASCSPKQPQTISFVVSGDPAEIAAYQKLKDSFMQSHPEISIELVQVAKSSEYLTRMAADMAAGTPSDIYLLNYRRYAEFAVKGAFEPLSPYIAKSKLLKESDFYPQALEPFRWQGQLMCIPQNISSLVVYYNKDLFQAAGVDFPKTGWTWDEFVATAQALTLDKDGDGKTDQFGLGVEPELIRLAPFIWQNLGIIADEDTNPTALMLDTSENYDTYYFFTEWQTRYHVVPNAEEEASEDSETRFLNGRTAMYFNSRRLVPTMRQSAAFDWDVAALPQKEEAATVLHADGYCMSSASKVKDAAWTFIEFANSVEGQTIVAGTGRTVPSLRAVAESPAFLDPAQKPANSKVWLDVIPSIHAMPISPLWNELEEVASEELSRAYYGQATVVDVVVETMERSEEIFLEYQP